MQASSMPTRILSAPVPTGTQQNTPVLKAVIILGKQTWPNSSLYPQTTSSTSSQTSTGTPITGYATLFFTTSIVKTSNNMTRAFLKKYWLILTSLGCISTAITLACAGDSRNEYG